MQRSVFKCVERIAPIQWNKWAWELVLKLWDFLNSKRFQAAAAVSCCPSVASGGNNVHGDSISVVRQIKVGWKKGLNLRAKWWFSVPVYIYLYVGEKESKILTC